MVSAVEEEPVVGDAALVMFVDQVGGDQVSLFFFCFFFFAKMVQAKVRCREHNENMQPLVVVGEDQKSSKAKSRCGKFPVR